MCQLNAKSCAKFANVNAALQSENWVKTHLAQ